MNLRPFLLAACALFATQAHGFFDEEPEFLHPDEAFRLSVAADGQGRALARFEIAEGYYLYRDKISFEAPGDTVSYTLPEGREKEDPLFGRVQVYHLEALVPLAGLAGTSAVITARYQGCAEAGVCYPMQTKMLPVAWDGQPAGGTAEDDLRTELSEADRIAFDLGARSMWLSFLAFIGFGFLLAFTPCVLPLLPILAGIIAGDSRPGTGRAFLLSLAYVLAMASVYALMGLGVGLTGANLQPYLQNVWVIGSFSVLLFVLALTMFGLIELRLPHAVRQRIHSVQQGIPGGRYVGAVAMGALAALIATPCVSPALVGALIYIADVGDAARGALSLFGLGLGLGLPLLAFGALEGRFLPRSGPWMTGVRGLFGLLLLALAVWMLDRVIPGRVTLILAGLLLIGTGVWLHALDPLPDISRVASRLGKGLGVALLVYGVVLLSGGAMGGDRLLHPWNVPGQHVVSSLAGTEEVVPASRKPFGGREVRNMEDLKRELGQGRGSPAVVYFHAEWCVTCNELNAFTFPDPAVQEALAETVRLSVDITENNDDHQELLGYYGLFGPPGILFFDREGREVRALRITGYVDTEGMLGILARLDPSVAER